MQQKKNKRYLPANFQKEYKTEMLELLLDNNKQNETSMIDGKYTNKTT